MQLHAAIDLFCGQYRASTASIYRRALRQLQDQIGPARLVEQIDFADLLRFEQHLRERSGYAPATQRMYLKTSRTFFAWLVRHGVINDSPMAGIRIKQVPRNRNDRAKAATDDEFARLRAYALSRIDTSTGTVQATAIRNYAILMLLADTGARRGGIVSMSTTDIDLAKMRALVTEKGDKTRPVAFGAETAYALSHWLRIRPTCQTDALFVATRGEPTAMYDELITKTLHRMCDAAGLTRKIGPHHFRHRKGHQMADAGIAPSIAATMLGHESVQTTLDHYYPQDYATALDVAQMLAEPAARTDQTGVIRLDHRKPG